MELLFLVALLFLANNFIVRDGQVIRSDGLGYYSYLPATFIYQDLNFNYTDTLVTKYYNHAEESQVFIQQIEETRVNKYFVGTALMQAPFFLAAHLYASGKDPAQADGYSDYYQKAVYFAALFYVLLGLYFIRLSLGRLGIKRIWIFLMQSAVLFASSLLHYVITDPAFSHVYSFALISIFSYLVLTFDKEKPRNLLWIALLLGMITLVRPVNLIVLAFVPFLILVSKQGRLDFLNILGFKKELLWAALVFVSIVSIQPLVWYFQTNQFLISSYGDESFHFLRPHIFDFLFSYRKGFFVYAPVWFFLFLVGLCFAFRDKQKQLVLSFLAAFVILVYVLSSWWYWSYGASFGSRVMVDFYPILVLISIPFYKNQSTLTKMLSVPVVIAFGALSLIQTYQYKKYILTWDSMDATGYWQVFMKMDQKYEGLLWQIPWREDWSDKEILSIANLSWDALTKDSQIFDFELTRDYSKIAILIDGNCTYDSGTSAFALEIQNAAGELQFYHEQQIFKAKGLENYSGQVRLVYYVQACEEGAYQLKIDFIKSDRTRCNKGISVQLHGLK